MNRIPLALILLFTMGVAVFGQTAGSLDTTFNGSGKVIYDRDFADVYQDVVVQPDGKIVAIGSSANAVFAFSIEVTRYLTDGSFDPSFGTGGHYTYSVNTENMAYRCLLQPDGKIILCGHSTNYSIWSLLLIRLNTDGTPDPSFGTDGVVLYGAYSGESSALALALQDDGKIIVAGYTENQGVKAPTVVRFTASGEPDANFGNNGAVTISVTETDNDFAAVAIQSDGKVLAAGHISNGLSWFSLLIARFDANGIPDASYGTGGIVNMNLNNVDDEFFSLKLTSDDEAILCGFTVLNPPITYRMLLMKFKQSGQPDSTFGNNGVVTAGELSYTVGNALALQTDGRILVSGAAGELPPANSDWALWRYMADGSPDPDFGSNGTVTTEFFGNADEAQGIALNSDRIILAGKIRNTENSLDFAVARYLNDVGVGIPVVHQGFEMTIAPNPVRHNGTITVGSTAWNPDPAVIELVSVTGKSWSCISAQATGSSGYTMTLPSSLPAGFYFVRLRYGKTCSLPGKLVVTD